MATLLVKQNVEYIARWYDGQVKISVAGAAETNAFALATESGLQLGVYADGRLVITYQDSDGDVQRQYSSDNGTTWSA